MDSVQSLDDSLSLGVRIARLGSARHIPRISALMSRQCAGPSKLLKAYTTLFESFTAGRRGMLGQSKELARKAAKEFSSAGRPLQQAVSLEAAGFLEEADLIRTRCGVRTVLSGGSWVGGPLSRRLAEALTPRETQIAKLAAQGLTNRSIAELLGISQRTVQHHCESIFCKLGIRSRWQLAEANSSDAYPAG
jgi:DNA-binding CsgD family transcriptional regulator